MAVDAKRIARLTEELGGHENAMLYGLHLLNANLSRIADAIEPIAGAVARAVHDDEQLAAAPTQTFKVRPKRPSVEVPSFPFFVP
jgi:hypothetical protein